MIMIESHGKEEHVEVSLNYCSQNGRNLYRAPYYNRNLNIVLLLGTLRPIFLHTAALESESYEYLHTQVKKIKRARTHQRSSRPGK